MEQPNSKVLIDNRPSDLEYALLSQHVYLGNKIKPGDVLPGTDWKVKLTCGGDLNYFGVIYVNAKTKQVVLVHRGTDKLSNWVENLKGIYCNKNETPHKLIIFDFIDDAITASKEAYIAGYSDTEFHLSFSGHSLGAFLAELSVFYCHSKDNKTVNAVTFESPGCRESLEAVQANHPDGKVDLERLDIVSYLSYPNVVNTCNHHVGTIYALTPHIDVSQSIFNSLLRYGKSHMVREENQDLRKIHSMDGIIAELSKEECKPGYVLDWPMGSQRNQFFKYVKFEKGYYLLSDEITVEEGSSEEAEISYKDFELSYKAHYRVDSKLNAKCMLPLKHFEESFKKWLEIFYEHLGKCQMIGTFDAKKFIDEFTKLGITSDVISYLLSSKLTKEQNGLKLFHVHESLKQSPAEIRKKLSTWINAHEKESQMLLKFVIQLADRPAAPPEAVQTLTYEYSPAAKVHGATFEASVNDWNQLSPAVISATINASKGTPDNVLNATVAAFHKIHDERPRPEDAATAKMNVKVAHVFESKGLTFKFSTTPKQAEEKDPSKDIMQNPSGPHL